MKAQNNQDMDENTGGTCKIIKYFPNNVLINYDYNKSFRKSCETCSLVIKENVYTVSVDSIECNAEAVSLRNKLYLCCPELDLYINSKKTLCVNCFNIVNIMNKFVRKCYTSTGQLNKNYQSIQNIYQLEDFSFDVKKEIKTEELDLSEIDSFADTELLCPTTSDKNYCFIQKQTTDIDCQSSYSSERNKDFILLHTKRMPYKPLEYNKKHWPKVLLNQHLKLQTVKKTLKQLYNFTKKPCHNWKQILKHAINKPFNYFGNNRSSIHEIHTEKKFNCSQCDYSSTKKTSLIIHLRSHIKDKLLKCYQCDYSSVVKRNLIIHLRIHTEKKLFKCYHCNYCSNYKNDLIRHIRIHTGEKPFKCTYCNYSAKESKSLIIHIRSHTGEKPFKCTLCQYSASMKDQLIVHKRIHTGEKPFKCSQCNYCAVTKRYLSVHKRTHTGEKPYKCLLCNYSATRKDTLAVHKRTHTGEKPFKCSLCKYSSTIKYSLRIHIRTHTGEKPFKCCLCEYSTANKNSLRIHICTHTGEKPYKCSLCDYSATRKDYLTVHKRTHSEKKLFQCSFCDYSASNKKSLITHICSHPGKRTV